MLPPNMPPLPIGMPPLPTSSKASTQVSD